MLFGLSFDDAPKIDKTLNDDERVDFGKSYLKVIHTPGHTLGGICFFFPEEKILFSGDTLFNGSIGRTDLQGGNFVSIIKSIKTKILTLPNDVTVYSGHGESTTIVEEKIHNPFLVK
jgi:glyoxylase-like metal-dependent hydrolase (beta-lactamase superfamily II)